MVVICISHFHWGIVFLKLEIKNVFLRSSNGCSHWARLGFLSALTLAPSIVRTDKTRVGDLPQSKAGLCEGQRQASSLLAEPAEVRLSVKPPSTGREGRLDMLQQTQSPPEVCSKDSYILQKSGSFVGPHFNECYQSKSMLLAHNGVYYFPEMLSLAIQSPNRIPYWRPYWKHCFLWDGEIGPSVSLSAYL